MSEQGLKFGKPLKADKVEPAVAPAVKAPSVGEALDSTEMAKNEQAVKGDESAVESDGPATYSSHPVHNFNLGPYEFKEAKLTLAADQVEAFEKLWQSQPPLIRNMIKKIDVAGAHKLVIARLGSKSVAGMDTTDNSFSDHDGAHNHEI